MKAIQVDQDILPIGDFKIHSARILRRLREEGRPIVITQHGRPAAVLVPTAEFDRWTERERFVAEVKAGLAEAEAGVSVTDEEVTRLMDEEFGSEP